MSGTGAISTKSRPELLSSFFSLQCKAPKEIHAILTETLACFLPGRAKDLSAALYYIRQLNASVAVLGHCSSILQFNPARHSLSFFGKKKSNLKKIHARA